MPGSPGSVNFYKGLDFFTNSRGAAMLSCCTQHSSRASKRWNCLLTVHRLLSIAYHLDGQRDGTSTTWPDLFLSLGSFSARKLANSTDCFYPGNHIAPTVSTQLDYVQDCARSPGFCVPYLMKWTKNLNYFRLPHSPDILTTWAVTELD